MNRAPRFVLLAGSAGAVLLASGAWYAFSPAYTDVGYMPRQPIPFSHALHAGELEVDCRYCHASVEISPVASLPPTRTCMNCHSLVARDSEALEPLRDSFASGEPIRWIRVHNLPDYAFFDHSVHIGAAIDCTRCHGDVAAMEELRQAEPLSMRWCLDCHRHPTDEIAWESRPGPVDCTACHR
ncbi:MAG: cytochrome c3 family protein [Acidobacteriota bacterium]|nr:MAG: cytochrome c3 family protein [Acidobacteriota bacterium]